MTLALNKYSAVNAQRNAIDSRSEGYVLGVGTKIFTVAGPVILYSTVFGMLYGLIYYIIGRF